MYLARGLGFGLLVPILLDRFISDAFMESIFIRYQIPLCLFHYNIAHCLKVSSSIRMP